MNHMAWALILLPLVAGCHSQYTGNNIRPSGLAVKANEFAAPWKDPSKALVIDAFAGNSIDWDKLGNEPRLVAIIHKATSGTNAVDPEYAARKAEVKKRGYLWGSYHWGIAGNPEKQADYYIDTVKPSADELMALDLEDPGSRSFMSVDEAIRFALRVKARTGRYPVLYTNHKGASLLAGRFRNSVLADMPLWYARFVPEVRDFPTGAWSSYTLWQFSSEIKKQYSIPGTKPDIDISVFNGTAGELKKKWPFTATSKKIDPE